jgi:hypothetical protein
MVTRFCQLINYSLGETACERPARLKHGDVWLCAEHYDFVMDYVSGKLGSGAFVFGYDLSMDKDAVFSIAYKKLDKNSDFDV